MRSPRWQVLLLIRLARVNPLRLQKHRKGED